MYLHGAFSSRAFVPTALFAAVYLHVDVLATERIDSKLRLPKPTS